MRNFKNTLWIFIICIGISNNAIAGKKSVQQNTLKDTEFFIEKERKNTLEEAARLFNHAPASPRAPLPQKELAFSSPIIPFTFDAPARTIKLLSARQDVLEQSYRNYIQMGYGNYYTPYFEGVFSSPHNVPDTYALRMKCFSHSNKHWGEKTHALVEGYGKKIFEQFFIEGAINGYRDGYALEKDSNLVNNHLKINTAISTYNVEEFSAKIDGLFQYTLQKDMREREIACQGTGECTILESVDCQVQAGISAIHHNNTARNLYHCQFIIPSTTYDTGKYAIDMQWGMNFAYSGNDDTKKDFLHVSPILKVAYPFYQWIKPYVELKGDVKKNNLQAFLKANPQIQHIQSLWHTNVPIRLVAGAEGHITDEISFSKGIGLSYAKNAPQYQYDERLKVISTTGVGPVHVFGELIHANKQENWTTHLKGDIFYHISSTQKLYMPNYQLSLRSTYQLHDKVKLQGNCTWMNNIHVSKQQDSLEENYVDASGTIDYQWNSRISGFLKAQLPILTPSTAILYRPIRSPQITVGASYIW